MVAPGAVVPLVALVVRKHVVDVNNVTGDWEALQPQASPCADDTEFLKVNSAITIYDKISTRIENPASGPVGKRSIADLSPKLILDMRRLSHAGPLSSAPSLQGKNALVHCNAKVSLPLPDKNDSRKSVLTRATFEIHRSHESSTSGFFASAATWFDDAVRRFVKSFERATLSIRFCRMPVTLEFPKQDLLPPSSSERTAMKIIFCLPSAVLTNRACFSR